MPKLFPADYHKDMIFYWVPYPYKPDYHYVAVKFPWITAVSFVTEVSDETAGGEYLRLCARTHVLDDLAVIDLLASLQVRTEDSVWMDGDSIRSRLLRCRPSAPGLDSGR
jgi:hypothetical protein